MNGWILIHFVLLLLIDAKLGKKCTLLDLSRRASVPESESQGVAVLTCITKNQDPDGTPKLDRLTSADLETCQRVEEEMKTGEAEKEKSEELPEGDSAEKMDLEPTDPVSDENKGMSLKLFI